MNSFKKYPKLNLLFIVRLIVIVTLLLSAGYFKYFINSKLEDVQSKFMDKEIIQEFEVVSSMINTSINMFVLIAFLLIGLLHYIQEKTDLENKRLDKIETDGKNKLL